MRSYLVLKYFLNVCVSVIYTKKFTKKGHSDLEERASQGFKEDVELEKIERKFV